MDQHVTVNCNPFLVRAERDCPIPSQCSLRIKCATFNIPPFNHYRHTSSYCTLQTVRFLKIKGLWQPCVEQVCQRCFPNSVCLLCHILVILVSQTFPLLLYSLRWSVISDYNSLKAQVMVSIF